MSSCPACGGTLTPWRTVAAGEPADHRRYPLERCSTCASAVTRGDPPAPDLYESGAYARRPPRVRGLVRALQRAAVAQPVRMLRCAGVAPGARVLDLGAGGGRLVEALRRAGYDAVGIEPSARGVAAALARGRPVIREAIADHDDSGLDAAVLWHVLEHLDEPGAALDRAAGWLRPGGVALVAVPNLASVQASLAGGDWLHLDVPRHRMHLTAEGLHTLLERHGLRVERAVHMVWEHNPGSMWMALLGRLGMTPGFPWHLVKHNIDARPRDLALLVAGLPLAPLATLAEAAAAAARRGGTVAVVARRG